MRRKFLEELTYPRMVAMSNIKLADCNQSGYFNQLDTTCLACAQVEECNWLNSIDKFNDLVNQPVAMLYESLLFGIKYVDAQNVRAEHNVKRCICESCAWVRSARRLAREYTNQAM